MSLRRITNRGRRGGHLENPTTLPLDYSRAAFDRATEAANTDTRSPGKGGTGAFAGAFLEASEAANWKLTNVARIFSDGAYLCESARTNDLAESWFDDTLWATIGAAALTSDDAASPDFDSSGESAATLVFSASAADGVSHVTTIGAGAGTDNDSAFISCWLRAVSGTEEARIGLLDKDGVTTLLSGDLPLTTTFTRFTFEVLDIGAGILSPEAIVFNSSDAAARTIEVWGFQVEHNAPFVSSPIRASGAASTRNKDDMKFPSGNWPNFIASEKFTFTWVPEFNAADDPVGGRIYAFFFSTGTHLLHVRFSGAVWQVFFLNSAGGTTKSLSGGAAAWVADDLITVIADHVSGDLSIQVNADPPQVTLGGAAAGGSWDNMAAQLFVGQTNALINQCNGVLSLPMAA